MEKNSDVAREIEQLKEFLEKHPKKDEVYPVIDRIHTIIHEHKQTKAIEKHHEAIHEIINKTLSS